jgi:hypothetical protein
MPLFTLALQTLWPKIEHPTCVYTLVFIHIDCICVQQEQAEVGRRSFDNFKF